MADNSSWRTIQLQGNAPWGFRLTNSSIQPGLIVSKVRERSKAYAAGLRENDIILYLNALPTHSMTLQEASDLIDSSETLRLVVASSSLNTNIKRNDEAHNITHYDNNDNLRFGLKNNTSDNNNNNIHNNTQTPSSNTNLYAEQQNQYRIGMSEERSINSNTIQLQQPHNNNYTQTHSTTTTTTTTTDSGRNRLLSNPAFSKLFSSSSSNQHKLSGFKQQQQPNTSFSNIQQRKNNEQSYSNMSNSGYQRQHLQPQQRQRYDSGHSQSSNTFRVGPSPTRRNYFSATESCGEETDNDDSVFMSNEPNNNNNNGVNTKTSFASLTLRQPLKDVNYFSDTETIQNSSPFNYYKVKQQNTLPKPYRPFGGASTSQRSSYNQAHSSTPQINNQPVSTGTASFYNKYATTKSAQQQQQQPKPQSTLFNNPNTQNPYSPSTTTTTTTTTTATTNQFKVPNIYEKINPQNRLPSTSYQFPVPSGLLRKTSSNEQHQQQYQYQPQPQQQQQQVDQRHHSNEQEDLVFNPYKKYEEEMGTELMKHAEREKPLYADSYFYNSPLFNYPTIDDQKRLAKVICATLEGSDPDKSKYHKYKKKQLNSQSQDESGYDITQQQQQLPFSPYSAANTSGYSPSPSHKAQNVFIFDDNLPDVVRKSIAQAESADPVRMVQAPEEFKQLHYTEHNTHTQMPPQAAMSLAAALQSTGGRGAQIFQKRKAKSEKWVVDETNVKKGHNPFLMYPPKEYHQFQPPPSPLPAPIIPKAAPIVQQQKHEEPRSNFSDFNLRARGWNTNDDHNTQSSRVPLKLAIDQSIREGIQELHFRSDDHSRNQSQQRDSSYHRQPVVELESNPNKIDLSFWNANNNQALSENRNIAVSKDGIQNLKQRFFDTFSTDNNNTNTNNYNNRINSIKFQTKKLPQFEPAKINYTTTPQISKVKLNKLNNDFLTNNPPSNQYSQYNYDNIRPTHTYSYDDQVAASDL